MPVPAGGAQRDITGLLRHGPGGEAIACQRNSPPFHTARGADNRMCVLRAADRKQPVALYSCTIPSAGQTSKTVTRMSMSCNHELRGSSVPPSQARMQTHRPTGTRPKSPFGGCRISTGIHDDFERF